MSQNPEKALLDEYHQTALLAILSTKPTEISTWEFANYAKRSLDLAKEMIKARNDDEQLS